MDTVVLKFVNWVQWEKAQPSLTKNIDFSEKAEDDPYQQGLKTTKSTDEAASDEEGAWHSRSRHIEYNQFGASKQENVINRSKALLTTTTSKS